jgi:hypothetical protein
MMELLLILPQHKAVFGLSSHILMDEMNQIDFVASMV